MRFMENAVKTLTARYGRRGEEILERYKTTRNITPVFWESYLIHKL